MDKWRDFEKDILPNPANAGEPDKDREGRILTFMTVYLLLRQPLDPGKTQRAVMTLDQTFVFRAKGLFNPKNHMKEEVFRGANSLRRLDGFFDKVPQGPDQVDDYWWNQYNSAVINAFGEKSKQGVYYSPQAQAQKVSAVAAASASTTTYSNHKFSVDPAKNFRTNLEALSYDAKGPFYSLSSDMVKLIWLKVIETDGAKAIDEWKTEIEPKLPVEKVGYYRAAFAVVRALYNQKEEDLTLKVDERMENKLVSVIYALVKKMADYEKRFDESIPGLRVPAESIFNQLNAAMAEAKVVSPALALSANGGIDLNTSNGMIWKIAKDGRGVEMRVDPAMIERVKREGISSLSPVIFRITPITSIWPLVGLKGPMNG